MPLETGTKLVVQGVWDSTPISPGRLIIKINPSFVYGTGYNPSTRVFLEELELLVLPNMIVLDIGTGTGILAIAAVKLGAGVVHATDRSKLAIDTAKANFSSNGVTNEINLVLGTFPPGVSRVDLVLCNIGGRADTVIDLITKAASLLTLGGLVAVGVEPEDRALVEAEVIMKKLSLVNSTAFTGGVFLVFRKGS